MLQHNRWRMHALEKGPREGSPQQGFAEDHVLKRLVQE